MNRRKKVLAWFLLFSSINVSAQHYGFNYQGTALGEPGPLMFGSTQDNFAEYFTKNEYNAVFVDIEHIWKSPINGIMPHPPNVDFSGTTFNGRVVLLVHGDESGKLTLLSKTDERLSRYSIGDFVDQF